MVKIKSGDLIAMSREAAMWHSRVMKLLQILALEAHCPGWSVLGSVGDSTQPFKMFTVARNNIFIILFFLTACSTSTPQVTPQLITVYSTSAAQPWLSDLYNCAGLQNSVVLSRIDDSYSAEIVLRIGEPKILASPAYQIDTEEILIVTHRASPIQNLTLDEARAIFSGQGDPSVQLWAYTSGEDIQEVFDQAVMEGRNVSSSARIAAHPQQMSDTLVNEPNTVGILPGHWKVGDTRFVYTIPNIPVLAVTPNVPEGAVKDLISCLQK